TDGMPLQILHRAPELEEHVVGSPPEEEGVGALEGRCDVLTCRVIARAPCPAAAMESVSQILSCRAAVALSHSVEADLGDGGEFHLFALRRYGIRPRDAFHLCNERWHPDETRTRRKSDFPARRRPAASGVG